MFTAEELEECDIFPKKITVQGTIKFLAYVMIMVTAAILMYSFYSGRDFTSLITLEGLKYGSESYFLNRLNKLDSRFDYNISDRYSTNFDDLEKDRFLFIKNYVTQSLPLIIKNMTQSIIFDKLKKDENYLANYLPLDRDIIVEKRSDPNIVYFMDGFSTIGMNYNHFLENAKNKSKILNYIINEISLDDMYKEIVTKYKNSISFLKYMSYSGIKYTEGFDEIINPGHMEYTENIYCQIEGEMDIMVISPLQRSIIYPYKKGYGPTNYSAVNFFKAEYGRFTNFRDTHRLYISLSKGDCLYIPAFWWYSYKTSDNKHFVNLKFEFQAHSRWAEGIMLGLQKDEV